MTNPRLRLLAALAASILGLALPAGASQYILRLKAGASISQVDARHGLTVIRPLTDDGQTVYLVSAPAPASPSFLKQISVDPAVVAVEPDAEITSRETPPAAPPITNVAALLSAIQNRTPTPYYGSVVRGAYVQQPTASLIHLPEALAEFGGGRATVAVIDTGVDPTHPALRQVLVPGYDFTRDQPGLASELADLSQSTVAILDQSTVAILDGKKYAMILNQSTVAILDQSTVAILDGGQLPSHFGHGTMVAGLIHLVAPTARIMPLKAFHADGSANLSDIVRAIYYAVDHNAAVINMSFSSQTASPAVTAAMQYAWAHRVICVASAGNDGGKVLVYPAGDPGVIGVASTSPLDRRSVFSNYGVSSAHFAAPGEALITTYPGNNYAGVWGTSFSTALTSGGAALLLQVAPRIEPGDVRDALEHGHPLDIDGLGDARLDVQSMLLYLMLGGN